MAFETVTVVADGYAYRTWIETTVEAGAAQAARSFSIVAAEPDQLMMQGWPLRPGVLVEVKASGDTLVKGYIDDYSPEFAAGSHRATITGRSKAKDAIDSSAIHETGEWKKKKLTEIAGDLLDPFGLKLDNALDDLKRIPIWRLAPGATVFNEIEAMARSQGALIVGTADGNMKLTRADKFKMHAGALREGVSIIRGSAHLSEKDKHDKVHARGQKSKGSGKDSHRLEHVARDQTVERYRPLLIIAEGDIDSERLRQRGNWQVERAAGWSTTAEIEVAGWRDEAGALWDPEKLVFVESKKLKISQLMAIKQVRFQQSNEHGTMATLSLVDPRALGGKDAKGKSNSAWKTGAQ